MKKNYLLSAAAAFLLAVTGCSDDIGNGNDPAPEEDGNKVYMTVNVSTASQGALTKAGGTPSTSNENGAGWGEDGNGFLEELSSSNEGKVYDVNIFLVKYDDNDFDTYPLKFFNSSDAANKEIAGQGWYQSTVGIDPSGGGEPAHDAGKVTMKVTMNGELPTTSQRYQVFTVVNAGYRMDGIATMDALRERITERGLWTGNNVRQADHFIMSTHKMNSTTIEGTSIVGISTANADEANPAETTVFVERMAARIDLGYAETLSMTEVPATSPIYGKGSFNLTGYKVVNQWKGNSYVFKRVSSSVSQNFNAGSSLADALAGSYTNTGNGYKYLGDEVWRMGTTLPAGTYNYVLDPNISNKKKPTGENDNPWDDFKDNYINYFNPDNANTLNTTEMDPIPTTQDNIHYGTDRTYYPVVYTKENTLDREAQVNGYSTGVIFESEFMPTTEGESAFKVSHYNNGKIEAVNLGSDKTFLLALHENTDGSIVRVVYEDLPSVAARAFNLESGSSESLLKGLMDGWTGVTTKPDFSSVQNAIEGMSDQNRFEKEFKDYLHKLIEGKTDWDDELTSKLCYDQFRRSQNTNSGGFLPDTRTDPDDFTPTQIGNLYQYYDVSLYKGGKSYHKFWIRHNDNGNYGMMGVMEFCIVRNNVYQLYVTGIRSLGDPLPYTPGKDDPNTPDESDDVTIDVTIYVKDWVQRKNKDIVI